MPTSNHPSPPPSQLTIQEVLTRFNPYARIRSARGGLLTTSRVRPREEERAFDNLQQAMARLRASSRKQDTEGP